MSSRVRPSPSATLERIVSGMAVRKNFRASSRNVSSSSVKFRSIWVPLSFRGGAFQTVGEFLAHLDDLWSDHDLAITGPRIACEIVVMFFLRFEERGQRLDLCHQRAWPDFRVGQFLITASAVAFCASEVVRMMERYCDPTSFPWRFRVVGSWMVKNTCSRSA